jgi:hypothetical protein
MEKGVKASSFGAFVCDILGHLWELLRSAPFEHNGNLCELTPVDHSCPYHTRAFLQRTTRKSE